MRTPRQERETARLLRELARRLSELPRSMPEFESNQGLFDWLEEHREETAAHHSRVGQSLVAARVFPILTRPRPKFRDVADKPITCPACEFTGWVKIGRIREAGPLRVGCPRCKQAFDWSAG